MEQYEADLDDEQLDKLIDIFIDSRATHIRTLRGLDSWADRIHKLNEKWWVNPHTGEPIERNIGEMLMLVNSELCEALEGHRKNLMDEKLPQYRNFDVEIADAMIRLFDICGGLGINIEEVIEAKLAYNAVREDHKLENRVKPGGKAY